jgi:uncharacterized protein YraI
MRHIILLAAFSLMLTLSAPARAVDSFTMQEDMGLRAGPGTNYRLLTIFPEPGTKLELHGCIHTYRWCHVSANGLRGWIRAKHLSIPQSGHNNRVELYGHQLRVPVLIQDERGWRRYHPERDFALFHNVGGQPRKFKTAAASHCYDSGRGSDCGLRIFNHSGRAATVVTRSNDDYLARTAGGEPTVMTVVTTTTTRTPVTQAGTRGNDVYNN